MNGKRRRKARRKAPLTILTLVLLAAGLSIILVPALIRDMKLNHYAQEYVALVELANSVNTAQPLDMADSATTTKLSQAGAIIPQAEVMLPDEMAMPYEPLPDSSDTEKPPLETTLPSMHTLRGWYGIRFKCQ